MRSIILSAFLLVTTLTFSQKNSFTLSGKIKGLDSKKMNILFRDATAPKGYRIDSIMVNNESFSYTGIVNEIAYFNLWTGVDRVMKKTGGGYIPAKSSTLQFFAAPGAHIKLSGSITDFIDAYPSGDVANNDLATLNKMINPIINESVNLELKVANKEITDSAEVARIKKTTTELDNNVIKIKDKFIEDNPTSVAAIWLLSDMMLRSQVSHERAIELFAKMNKEKLVAVPFYSEVAKRVDGIVATGAGKQVPEINSVHTFDGKKFELSSLRGKYVVIDFWGTWCGPCIAGMPKMKEYLDKYKGKMEIVGVAQESDNGERWKEFLNKNPDYLWRQVLNRKNEEDFILNFNVAGFPTKIIIDPDGKIVERFVGEDEGIYKKLDEIFK